MSASPSARLAPEAFEWFACVCRATCLACRKLQPSEEFGRKEAVPHEGSQPALTRVRLANSQFKRVYVEPFIRSLLTR